MTKIIENVDVTIVGAGPTGLTTALLLRRLGVSVCIIDKASSSLQLGRADALNARSQELLELIGCLSDLEPKGLKCNTSSTFKDGAFVSRQNAWWVGLKNVHRPNFLMIGQPEIERTLIAHLDIPVRRGVVVTDIEEVSEGDEGFVRTTCEDRIILSKYAVGSDGARSFVRNHLQIPFEGTKPNMIWAVLDTFLDTDFPVCDEIISFEVEGQSRVSWIPRERGMARFYVLLDGEITQPRVENEIRRFLSPYRVDFKATEWFSQFEVKERVAKSFFSSGKRIVLAGDAGHVHSVNGGQGLNTGLSDAFALAWRLSLAIKGQEHALESYDTERGTTSRNVIDVAAKLVRSTRETAKEYVSLIEKNAKYITGIGVDYSLDSSMIRGNPIGLFSPGHRCPDVYLHSIDGSEPARRIYTLAAYDKFIVLIRAGETIDGLLDLRASHQFVEAWRIGAEKRAESAPQMGRCFDSMTEDGKTRAITLPKGNAVVIRPDMYVGCCGDLETVKEYVEMVSVAPSHK